MSSPALPSIGDLGLIAIEQTDFVSDITADPVGLLTAASFAAESAAEIWEVAAGAAAYETVPISLIHLVRDVLVERAYDLQRAADKVADDALADAIAAGDVDRDGNFLPYDFYRGV